MFQDDLTFLVDPPAFDRDAGGAAVDRGEEADSVKHPAPLRADFLVVFVLVGDINGKTLDRDVGGAETLCQWDGLIDGLRPPNVTKPPSRARFFSLLGSGAEVSPRSLCGMARCRQKPKGE